MYSDNLQLLDGHGVHSKIADFIVGEPVDENGLKYQSLTLTVPMTRGIQVGTKLTVYDVTNDKPVITFMVERVLTQLKGEQFFKVEGRNYIEFPKDA